jgi:hypothetical protein
VHWHGWLADHWDEDAAQGLTASRLAARARFPG